ncbi:GIY-YIG nuclease family protein [Verrucomicrobia bacterium]|nr:GIY-YIG nuclease family protein [Verrucomicrobiota bacterium]
MAKGWVYVFSNKSMPSLVKIGCTSKDPKGRAKELSQETGVPSPFVVEYEALTEDYERMEQRAHQRLRSKRPNKNREFFSCTIEEAIIAIKSEFGDRIIHENYEKERREKVGREIEAKRKEDARIRERRQEEEAERQKRKAEEEAERQKRKAEEERQKKIASEAQVKRQEKAEREEQVEWQKEWGKYMWLVLGVVVLLFYVKETHHRETFDDNYIQTTGELLSQREMHQKTGPSTWLVKYEFAVGGQIYKGVDRVNNTNQLPVQVFYKPEDPTRNSLDKVDSGYYGIPAGDSPNFLLIFSVLSFLAAQPWRLFTWIK